MMGFSASLPWDRGEETYNVVGTLTKISGNHTLKVGSEVRYHSVGRSDPAEILGRVNRALAEDLEDLPHLLVRQFLGVLDDMENFGLVVHVGQHTARGPGLASNAGRDRASNCAPFHPD